MNALVHVHSLARCYSKWAMRLRHFEDDRMMVYSDPVSAEADSANLTCVTYRIPCILCQQFCVHVYNASSVS
jgi:hypothetical protein